MEPLVSVVILSMNAPPHLLEQLNSQTYKNFEIIIASENGIVHAMNLALSKAKGEIFVRIDDDVELSNIWLDEIIKPFSDPYVAGATGPTYVPATRRMNRDSIRIAEHPNRFLKWMFENRTYEPAIIYKCGSVSYGSNFQEKMPKKYMLSDYYDFYCEHLEGTNWAMRTQLIKDVGGFDEKFDGVCEWFDTDVEQKIIKKGYRLAYNPKAIVWHMLEKGSHFNQRYEMISRIKNWLRFHFRHSKFHYKKLIWLAMMIGYALCPKRK